MKFKKILAILLAVVLVAATFAACSSGGDDTGGSASGEKTHIYVLTASEDHGWTGSVAKFAKEKAKEINDAGKYFAEVITATDAADQITQVEDIVAKNEKNIAVVIQPMDDTVQSAIQQLVDNNIPYVAFDRIIDAVSSTAVSNVKGDNSGIGAGAAAYFVENGMNPGDRVYVYQGDTSSVTTLRDEGFTQYLLGEKEFNGATIAADKQWTQEQIDSAITFSGAMNWSRSDTKTSYETLMGDPSNAEIKWFYAEDDELAMGILEALNGGGIADSTKQAIYETKPFITGCGGLDEYYEVLRGNSYQEIAGQIGGVMSVTYSPSMIQTAIQDMVDHLDGKEVTQDHVIACENVTPENVANYQSFT